MDQVPLGMISGMACTADLPRPGWRGAIAVALVTLALTGHAAFSQMPAAAPGSTAVTPLLMQFFCRREPAQCASQPGSVIAWDDKLQARLRRVNQQVNQAIAPQINPPRGWRVAPLAGDCNDYALTKRSQLIDLGVPAGALRLAITDTPGGEPHAVLVVQTTEGGVVLDNLGDAIKSLPLSGYAIRTMSSPDPLQWITG